MLKLVNLIFYSHVTTIHVYVTYDDGIKHTGTRVKCVNVCM